MVVTKLDVLDEFDTIPVCVGYRNGRGRSRRYAAHRGGNRRLRAGLRMPAGMAKLHLRHLVVRRTAAQGQGLPGFSGEPTGVEVGCISTGPERNQTIVRAGSRFEKLVAGRILTLIVCLPAILSGQDPREIVRRSVEIDRKNLEIARNYTYLERQEVRDLDGSGKVKNTEAQTTDVTLLEGSPYRRLVARNWPAAFAQGAEERGRQAAQRAWEAAASGNSGGARAPDCGLGAPAGAPARAPGGAAGCVRFPAVWEESVGEGRGLCDRRHAQARLQTATAFGGALPEVQARLRSIRTTTTGPR